MYDRKNFVRPKMSRMCLFFIVIANGNRRVAVKYVPLMLQGTARTWLNSLKPYSVNSWLDFTEVFVRNFTSTYKRPPKPRQLPLCV